MGRRRVDAGPVDRADGMDDLERRAVKLSQLEVQVALTPGLSKFDSEVAERPTSGSRCRRLANSTGRQPRGGPRVATVDTSDASGSEGSPGWGAEVLVWPPFESMPNFSFVSQIRARNIVYSFAQLFVNVNAIVSQNFVTVAIVFVEL